MFGVATALSVMSDFLEKISVDTYLVIVFTGIRPDPAKDHFSPSGFWRIDKSINLSV